MAGEDDRRRFSAWLAADPAHGRALAQARALWTSLDGPAARLGADGWHRAPERTRARHALRMAAAAAVCAVIAGGLLWRDPGFIDRALADHATRPGEHREVMLADGSRLYLDGDSAVSVTLGAGGREIRLMRGRVWFDVAPDPGRPFTVTADAIAARVLGTAFGVDGESASVTVEHGLVAVSAPRGGEARLSEGERIAASGGMLGAATAVEPEVELAWRRGLIVLDAAPLGRVADELDRMSPGRVVIPDAGLRALTLSGVFRVDEPEAVLEAMRSALGLRTLTVPGLATVVYR